MIEAENVVLAHHNPIPWRWEEGKVDSLPHGSKLIPVPKMYKVLPTSPRGPDTSSLIMPSLRVV